MAGSKANKASSFAVVAGTLLGILTACGASPAPIAAKPSPPPAVAPPAPVAPVAVGHPSATVIPRLNFFAPTERADVELSFDGKHLAWLAARNGVTHVWTAPLDDLSAAKVVSSRPVQQFIWSFDNKHIVYLQAAAANEPNQHAFSVDITDGKTIDLTPGDGIHASFLAHSSKHPTSILLGENARNPAVVDAYNVDVVTGKQSIALENTENFDGMLADINLKVLLVHASSPDGSGAFLARGKHGWQKRIEIPANDAKSAMVVNFDSTDKFAYVIDSRDRDSNVLASIDLATGTEKVLYDPGAGVIDSVFANPLDGSLLAVGVIRERRTWHPLDRSLQADFDALAKVDSGDIKVVYPSGDQKTWLVTFESDHRGTRWYVWNRSTKAAKFLFSDNPLLDQIADSLSTTHAHTIPSRDGLDLVSYITLPKDSDPDGDGVPNAPLPTVVLVRTDAAGSDQWTYDPKTQWLANRGYAVMTVNARGADRFGKRFAAAGNGQWGQRMEDDLVDGVRWAIDHHITDGKRVAIMGVNYGAYAALMGVITPKGDVAATPWQPPFACAVAVNGPVSLQATMATLSSQLGDKFDVFKQRVGDWSTPSGAAQLAAISPLSHAAEIHKPVLLAFGDHVTDTKPEDVKSLVDTMVKNHAPITFASLVGEAGEIQQPGNVLTMMAMTEAFLSANIGGVYQPITTEERAASTVKIDVGMNGLPGFNP